MRTGTDKRRALLPALTLLALVLLDLATPSGSLALAPLFALAPLAACATLPAAPTAGFATAALLAAASSWLWSDHGGVAQHLVRVLDVAAVGAAAVVIAAVRMRQVRRLGHLTRIAEVAQRAVLPVVPPHVRSTEVAVRYQSATDDAVIGGDLYDCYHSRTHTRFLIGDVRGKGIEAVEQAARVIRAFRQAAAVEGGLDAVAEDMSGYLVPFFDPEEFVTAVLLDTTDALHPLLVNAGHPQPLLVRADGTYTFLGYDADPPLGLGRRYVSHRLDWRPGDRLLLYTDGLSEARDARGDFLDLRELVPLLVGGPLEESLKQVLARVRAHSASGELADDVAMMLLEHSASQHEDPPMTSQHDWLSLMPT